MKRMIGGMAALAVLATAGSPEVAQAQQGGGWWDWAAQEVLGGEQVRTSGGIVVIPDGRRDTGRNDRGRQQRQHGNGPAFCRSGQGHPVHGRQWCVQRGFGLGDRRYDDRWERRSWDDVVFRTPQNRRTGAVSQESVAETLGRVVLGRFVGPDGSPVSREPITGRWIPASSGGQVLQLRSGGSPIAELTDLDGDGRVDVVLVYRGR